MSFMYLQKLGFHESNAEVIVKCAELQCASNSAPITIELERVISAFLPANNGGTKSAGHHYDIDWSHMVKAYDGEVAYNPEDNFNMWALKGSDESTFHNMHSVVPGARQVATRLSKDLQTSWFTAIQLAAVTDFHFYAFFGSEGLLTATRSTTDAEFLDAIVATGVWASTDVPDMASFKKLLHTSGKEFIIEGATHHFNPFTPPNKYQQFMKLLATKDDDALLTSLGVTNNAPLKARLVKTRESLTVLRSLLWGLRSIYLQQLNTIVIWTTIAVLMLAAMLSYCVCNLFKCKSKND